MLKNSYSGKREFGADNSSSRDRRTDLAKALKLVGLITLTIAATCSSPVQGQSGSRPDRGTVTNVPYDTSSVENINLQNGNVGLEIPLASLPAMAGGKLSFTLKAYYNSKLWDTYTEQRVVHPPEDNGSGELHAAGYDVEIPKPSNQGGWRVGLIYNIQCVGVSDLYVRNNNLDPSQDDQVLFGQPWTKCFLVSPDGSEHEIRPLNKSPYDGNNPFFFDFFKDSPVSTNQALRYYTVDGSFIWLTWYPPSDPLDFEAHLPDGTKVQQRKDGIQRITDSNSNSIKIFRDTDGTHFQDELTGREIKLLEYNDRYEVWYKSVAATAEKVVLVKGTTEIFGKFYTVQIPDLWGAQTPGPCTFQEGFSFGLSVIREIIFPQSESNQDPPKYTFNYSSDETDPNGAAYFSQCNGPNTYPNPTIGLGELRKMTTPTGAVHKYSYAMDFVHITSEPPTNLSAATNFVTSKTVEHDGAPPDVWTYNSNPAAGIGIVNNPDGSSTVLTSYNHFSGNPSTAGGTNGLGGLVYREKKSDRVVIERRWNRLVFSGATEAASGGKATFNPVVTEEYTSLLDDNGNVAKMAASKFQYDYNGNMTQQTDYDWFPDPTQVTRDSLGIPLGVPGNATILRSTDNAYHNSPGGDPTSTLVYAKTTNTILNAVKETITGNSTTQLSYDNQSYGAAPVQGNVTKSSSWDSATQQWINSLIGYDSYGNVTSKTDPNGNSVIIVFGDITHANPTSTTVNPDNGTGTQTSSTTYDFETGLPLTSTDVNGQTYSIGYVNHLLGAIDPYGRPGTTFSPYIVLNGVTKRQTSKTYYEDASRRTRVESDLFSEDDQLLKTRVSRDQLGRVILNEKNENGSSTYSISSQTIYKTADRVVLTSNPARSTASTSDGWTRTTTDNLGRSVEVATFSGVAQPPITGTNSNWVGSITSSYSANATTLTDQAGRVRRSLVDPLGRLIRVDEPNNAGQLGNMDTPIQPTIYGYDVLGNLTSVQQPGTTAEQCGGAPNCSQTRTYAYSSLSRLLTSSNPESGTVIYDYFPNGNLKKRTDARNIQTTYAYDGLNRPKTLTYSDATPTVTYTYDTLANGKGRLTSVSSSVSTYRFKNYDVLGRVKEVEEELGTKTYTLFYSYDLGGRITSITYPSNRVVNYTYDSSARLDNFSGNLGSGGANRAYSTGIVYDAADRMTKEQFGTDTAIYNKLRYNSRGQLSEIRESTSYTGEADVTWDRGKIINDYTLQCSGVECNGSDNNGNLRKQTVSVPNDENLTTTWYQQYEYDTLNRLTKVNEFNSQASLLWKQWFQYDRFGNRKIDGSNTSLDIPRPEFEVEVATNRLLAPGDLALAANQRKMRYDSVGNLVNDSWTSFGSSVPGAITRTYDAENRMTSALDDAGGTTQYLYDGNGRRVRRIITNKPEVWQVHGLSGELLAEYPANGDASAPLKEYGYRNGQLLVTVDAATNSATPPTVLTAAPYNGGPSISLSWTASGATNYRIEKAVSKNGPYNFAGVSTTAGFIDNGVSSGAAYLYKVCAADSQNACTSAYSNVVLGLAFAFITDPVIKSFAEDPVNATSPKIGHITELRTAVNAVRTLAGRSPANWTNVNLQIGVSLISVDDVRDLRARLNEALSDLGMSLPTYTDPLLIGFGEDAQNATSIKAIHIRELREFVRSGVGGSGGSSGSSLQIRWLVSDQLGTPRIVFDKTGLLNTTSRHDYLPFGEELAEQGLRAGLGYAVDSTRQKFTLKERDVETGLDYFVSRYFSSHLGRFTSPDSVAGSIVAPQTLNLYSYVQNNPIKFVDPTGHAAQDPQRDDDIDIVKITIHDRVQQMLEQARRHLEESKNKIREFWRTPSPFSSNPLVCPTGQCQSNRTVYDDAKTALDVAEKVNSLSRITMSFSDSYEINGSAFYVISGGARLTADGDVFLSFNTPLSSDLVNTFKDGFSSEEIQPKRLFGYSVTTTHLFGESNEASRRSFFSGGSLSGGGAVPVAGPLGIYGGGVYSPSSGQSGFQTGFAKPGVSGGYSWSPDKPTFHFELLRWKPN